MIPFKGNPIPIPMPKRLYIDSKPLSEEEFLLKEIKQIHIIENELLQKWLDQLPPIPPYHLKEKNLIQ